MNINDIYKKYMDAEHVSNKEMLALYMHFKRTSELLSPLGDSFRLAWMEANTLSNALRSFLINRGVLDREGNVLATLAPYDNPRTNYVSPAIDEICNTLDAGFYTKNAFHTPKALKKIRFWLQRWNEECDRIALMFQRDD